jgi:hypothetical protein
MSDYQPMVTWGTQAMTAAADLLANENPKECIKSFRASKIIKPVLYYCSVTPTRSFKHKPSTREGIKFNRLHIGKTAPR